MVFLLMICPRKRQECISDGNNLPFALDTIYLYGNISYFLPLKYKIGFLMANPNVQFFSEPIIFATKKALQ